MQNPGIALRAIALTACLLALGAACAPTHPAASTPTTPASPSTTNPNDTPNSIPYVVGERIGLPNGWLIRVGRVQRHYTAADLPAPPSGRQYVAVDISMQNQGDGTETVDAAKLFWLGDSTGKIDHVIRVPGHPNGLDGPYARNTSRSGRLVFEAPLHAELRMALDGPRIGTQQSIFQIYPPKVGPGN